MSQVKTDSLTEHTSGAGVSVDVEFHAAEVIDAQSGINFGDETLSHYDEGTWTPVIAGATTAGTQTYAAQVGSYTRVGRLVIANAKLVLSAKDAAMAGDVTITGLPFTSSAILGDSVVTCGYISLITLSTGYTQLCGLVPSNTNHILLRQTGSNAGPLPVDATALNGLAQITLSVAYMM